MAKVTSHDSDDDVIDITDSPPPAKRQRTGPSPTPVPQQRPATISTPAATSSSYFGAKSQSGAQAGTDAQRSISNGSVSKWKGHTRPAKLDIYRLPKDSQDDAEATPGQTRERTAEQVKREEQWDKRMAGGGVIRRRRSLALDDAAAAELRRITGGGDGDGDGDTGPSPGESPDPDTPLGATLDNPLDVDMEAGSERQRAAEGVGGKLAAKFTAKGAPAKGRKKKEPEPVGPSGQTYTPLEKQFMEIKAKHSDVLLMMEVGYKFK